MRFLLSCWVPALLVCLSGGFPAFAQDPLAIITTTDELTQAGAGGCGAPGRRECGAILHFGKGFPSDNSPGCTDPGSNLLRNDPYSTINLPMCNLPHPADNPQPPAVFIGFPPDIQDVTFYFTSDLHYERPTFHLPTQVGLPAAINKFAFSGTPWPANAGIPAAGKIGPPAAVVIGGDLTTGGGPTQLGDFRLLWETGQNPSSLAFPIMPGLGNHDAETADSFETAHRMWSYIKDYVTGVNMDSSSTGQLYTDDGNGSHNYSWDWGGVHFVQLNSWAGSRSSMFPHRSDGLAWLKNELQWSVGSSKRPVILIQHYDLEGIGDTANNSVVDRFSGESWKQMWWTVEDYNQFWNIIRDYNIVGLFDGHKHELQINRPEHYTGSLVTPSGGTTLLPGLALPTDSQGKLKIFDEFKNATGGQCDSPCSNGQATFFAARVSPSYLDVAAVGWSSTQGVPSIVPPSTATPLFWGNTSACRKRIDSQYIDVSSAIQFTSNGTVLDPLASFGCQATKCSLEVKNVSGLMLRGPLALRVQTTATGDSNALGVSNNVMNRSFVDSCDPHFGNPYILLAVDRLAPGESTSVPIQVTQNVDLSPGLVELAPIGGPTLFTDPTSITVNNNNPQPATIHILPGAATSFTTKIDYIALADGSDWVKVASSSTTNISLVYSHDILRLYSGALNAVLTITGNDGSSASIPITGNLSNVITSPANVSFASGNTQQVTVRSLGSTSISVNAVAASGYTVSPASGNTPVTFTLTAREVSEGTPGTYNEPLLLKWNPSNELQIPVTYDLERSTFSALPAGSSYYVDKVSYNVPTTFTWIAGQSHELEVRGSEEGGTKMAFDSWSDGGAELHFVTAPPFGTPTRYYAKLNTYYQVRSMLNPAGVQGTVAVTPAPQLFPNYYLPNTSISVRSTPAAGTFFDSYSGAFQSAVNPQQISVTKPLVISALFKPDSAAGNTVIETLPANKQVLVDGVAYQTPAEFHWSPQESHVVIADSYQTDASTTWAFKGWEDGVATPTRKLTGIASGYVKYTAVLQEQFKITATVSPAGSGSVAGSGFFPRLTSTLLTATAAAGFRFVDYSGPFSSQTNPVKVEALGGINLQANFEAVGSPTLYASVGPRSQDSAVNPDLLNLAVVLTNVGTGGAAGTLITAVDGFAVLEGSGNVPFVWDLTQLPLSLGAIGRKQSSSGVVQLNWPPACRRLRMTVHFSANSGLYQGSTILNLYR